MSSILTTDDLSAGYNGQAVIHHVGLELGKGEVTVLIGRNGAGKSTLISAIGGSLRTMSGRIEFEGAAIQREAAHRRSRRGLTIVPQNKGLFPGLSVEENLRLTRRLNRTDYDSTLELVFELFPVLPTRLKQVTGSLSGGEQQMVAISRALLTRPRLLILDEPSLGLSPRVAGEVFETIWRSLKAFDMSLLLVEQQISWIVDSGSAHKVYVLDQGEIVANGDASLLTSEEISSIYLGV